MDHIGDFPLAFIEGAEFAGRVYATPATKDAADISLTDSANILAREHARKLYGYNKMLQEIAGALFILKEKKPREKWVKRKWNGDNMRKTGEAPDIKKNKNDALLILEKFRVDTTAGAENYKKQMEEFAPLKPAYTPEDVDVAVSRIESHTIEQWWKELIPGKLAFRFYNAGHIIGSVSVLFRITENGKSSNVLFSGDLGSYKWGFHPTGLAVPPHNLPIDTVVVESTYGGKVRHNFAEWLRDFEQQIIHDLEKYNQIIIPTFAMDRTQLILNILIQMKKQWKIDVDIIQDSPSGTKHTINYLKHSRKLDPTIASKHVPSIHKTLYDDFAKSEWVKLAEFVDNINPANRHYTAADKNNRESLLAKWERKKIIVTSSGMAEGGMVISYLESHVSNPDVAFYFPGYLVPGTLGYALASESQPGWQQKKVEISGKTYEVQARMMQFNFLSGHGDEEDLMVWLWAMKLRKDATIRIVHGDIKGSSLALKHTLERSGKFKGINIIVPGLNEVNAFPISNPRPARKKPAAKLKK